MHQNEMESPMESPKHLKDGIIDFVAGSLGGIALVYVGQPLDTIKVKMQTFPNLYTNMFTCFKETLKADGISRGLYAGSVPALAANITENSVLFLCYGFCQKIIQNIFGIDKVNDLTTVHNASAGFIASFFSSLALCPTELLKCKLQAMHEIQKQQANGKQIERIGPTKLIRNILKDDGVVGLFRGLIPTLAREMPGYFVFFGAYEGTRELLRHDVNQTKDDIGLVRTMIAGAVGGAAFWTLTYPIDVAKSRIQVTNSNVNMFGTILLIIRQEGVSALYNGLTPTLIRTIPATATLFVTYEYSKSFLHRLF